MIIFEGMINIIKKVIWTVIVFTIGWSVGLAQDYGIPYRKGKLWGFCDDSLELVNQPQYDSFVTIEKNIYGVYKNGCQGVVLGTKEIIPCKYSQFERWRGRLLVDTDSKGYKTVFFPDGTPLELGKIVDFNNKIGYNRIEVIYPDHYKGFLKIDYNTKEVIWLVPKYYSFDRVSNYGNSSIMLKWDNYIRMDSTSDYRLLTFNSNDNTYTLKVPEVTQDKVKSFIDFENFESLPRNSSYSDRNPERDGTCYVFELTDLKLEVYKANFKQRNSQNDTKKNLEYSIPKRYKNYKMEEYIIDSSVLQNNHYVGDIGNYYPYNYVLYQEGKHWGIITEFGTKPAIYDSVIGYSGMIKPPKFQVFQRIGSVTYCGLISAENLTLLPIEYQNIEFNPNSYHEVIVRNSYQPYLLVTKADKQQLLDTRLKPILDKEYDAIIPIHSNFNEFTLKFGKKYGYYSVPSYGKLFLMPIFDYPVTGVDYLNRLTLWKLSDGKQFIGYGLPDGRVLFED